MGGHFSLGFWKSRPSRFCLRSILVFSGMLPYCLAFLDHPGFASHVLMSGSQIWNCEETSGLVTLRWVWLFRSRSCVSVCQIPDVLPLKVIRDDDDDDDDDDDQQISFLLEDSETSRFGRCHAKVISLSSCGSVPSFWRSSFWKLQSVRVISSAVIQVIYIHPEISERCHLKPW